MRYHSTRPRKQFLAGVSCPKCNAPDSIVHIQVYEPTFDEYIECVECDHSEHRPSEDSVREKNAPKITNAGIQIVSITDPRTYDPSKFKK